MHVRCLRAATLLITASLLLGASTCIAYAQGAFEINVGVEYAGNHATFTITVSHPFVDGTQDNFSLVFDADSDGITNRLISYHSNLDDHYPGNYWGMKDYKPWDSDPATPEPCGPLWHNDWEPVPSGWPVSETEMQTFTVSVPYDYLGGPGSEFRYAVWGIKIGVSDDDDPEGSIFGCWESSELYYLGTIPSQTDLVTTIISQEWIEEGSTYNVRFVVCNEGTDAAGSSVAGIYIDGSLEETVGIGALGPGDCTGTMTAGPFTVSGDGDIVMACADDNNQVAESNEGNNCRTVSEHGGGCFIATSACGPDDASVETLRAFRDTHLATDNIGSAFVSTYYKLSPPIAEFIDDHPSLKPVMRAALLPSVAISEAAVSTSLPMKTAIASSLMLISALAIVWLKRKSILRRF